MPSLWYGLGVVWLCLMLTRASWLAPRVVPARPLVFSTWRIVKVACQHPSEALVQTVSAAQQRHQLWRVTLSPTGEAWPQAEFESATPFDFATDAALRVVVVTTAARWWVLRRTACGGWSVSQTWSGPEVATPGAAPPRVSLSRDGLRGLVSTEQTWHALWRGEAAPHYQRQPWVAPGSESRGWTATAGPPSWWFVACPDAHHLDGEVQVLWGGPLDVPRRQVLTAPQPDGGYFGAQVVWTQTDTATWLWVSAPFAHQGVGAVYSWVRTAGADEFVTAEPLVVPDTVEQWGRQLAVSANAAYLAVTTTEHVFVLVMTPSGFRHHRRWRLPGDSPPLSVHVDNAGQPLLVTAHGWTTCREQ